jgi:hypothetical protein
LALIRLPVMVYGPGVLPMATPSRRLASITQLTTMPPRPAIAEVPWAEMSKPASWLPIIVHPVTTSPSAPQSEMPNRLSSTWHAVIRMPRGGGQYSFCSSRKIPFVPLPRAVHEVTVSRSVVPQPPMPIPIPAPPGSSPVSSRPHRSTRTASTTVSCRKSQPNPVAGVSCTYRSRNRPRSTYCRPSPLASGSYSYSSIPEPSTSKEANVQSARKLSRPAPCCAVVNHASGVGVPRAPGFSSRKRVSAIPAPIRETPERHTVAASRIR